MICSKKRIDAIEQRVKNAEERDGSIARHFKRIEEQTDALELRLKVAEERISSGATKLDSYVGAFCKLSRTIRAAFASLDVLGLLTRSAAISDAVAHEKAESIEQQIDGSPSTKPAATGTSDSSDKPTSTRGAPCEYGCEPPPCD
jgi:chromosome segregation ATPase